MNLLQKVFRPELDKAFVVTTGGSKAWPSPQLNWSSDRDALIKEVQQLDKDTGLPDAFLFDIGSEGAADRRMTLQTYSSGGFSVFDALWAMFNTDRRPARRVVVIFRRAWAHSPGLSARGGGIVEELHNRIVMAAQALGVSLYTVVLDEPPAVRADIGDTYHPTFAGQGTDSRQYDEAVHRERERAYAAGRANVGRLADETGGHLWFSKKKNYADAMEALVKELKGQYLLRFAPSSAPANGPVHGLRLTLKGRDAILCAPKGYLAPKEGAE